MESYAGRSGITVSSIEKTIDDETATIYEDYPTFKKDLTNYILNKDIRGISRMYSTTVSKKEVAKSISSFTLSTNQYTDFNNILSVNTVCSVDNKGNEYYGFFINDSSAEADIVYDRDSKTYSIIPTDSRVMRSLQMRDEFVNNCSLDRQ